MYLIVSPPEDGDEWCRPLASKVTCTIQGSQYPGAWGRMLGQMVWNAVMISLHEELHDTETEILNVYLCFYLDPTLCTPTRSA